MIKNLKTLLTLGVITMVTASSTAPASALTIKNNITTKSKGAVYLYVNGKEYKFNLNSNCTDKPSKPDNNNSSKPDNDNNDSGNNSSDNNSNNSDNSTNKPDDNNSNNQDSTSEFVSYQQQVVDLVNKERAKYNLSPLKSNTDLAKVATIKSQDMINKNYFDHNSPTYGTPFEMMKKFGIKYNTAGENIAMGQRTPAEVVNAWMNSEGHRKNILNSKFTQIGIGVAKNSKGQLYWTQMFIG